YDNGQKIKNGRTDKIFILERKTFLLGTELKQRNDYPNCKSPVINGALKYLLSVWSKCIFRSYG
ncbi:MAG: hypothetical protein NTV06_07940, partial [candidate division Zixibacteria bacterium]|nr:hypothetical protein [candidate division Zixibacteria bacterium]